MSTMRAQGLLFLLLLWPLFATACVAHAPTSPTSSFRTQLTEDWKYWMSQYPELATQFGVPGHNARWTDYSFPAIDARNEYLKNSLTRLRSVERGALESADQLNYDLYLDLLDSAVKGLAFGNDAVPIRTVIPHNLDMPMNQIEGLPQDVPLAMASMPTATVLDYEDITRRLQALPALVDQTIALMERGMAAGKTPPKITFRDVPAQIAAQIVNDPSKSPLLDALKTFPPSVPVAQRARLTQ